MTSANVQLVQQIYGFFGQGNIPAIIEQVADDVKWEAMGAPLLPSGGSYTKATVGVFFQNLAGTFDITEFSPNQFLENQDTVIVFGVIGGTARNTGKSFHSEWVMTWKIKDGKISAYQNYVDTANMYNAML